jgi:hypothetical protein
MSTPTDEEARGLAARWAAERAIASMEIEATDEQVELVCEHGVLWGQGRKRLYAWVLERTQRCTWVEAAQAVQRATGISEGAARALVASARGAS